MNESYEILIEKQGSDAVSMPSSIKMTGEDIVSVLAHARDVVYR